MSASSVRRIERSVVPEECGDTMTEASTTTGFLQEEAQLRTHRDPLHPDALTAGEQSSPLHQHSYLDPH